MTRLEASVESASYFQRMNIFDNEVIVCDWDGVVLEYKEAKTFKTDIFIGKRIEEGPIRECINSEKAFSMIIPKDIYGFRLKAFMEPIFEIDGSPSGVIAYATTLEWHDDLEKAIESIVSVTEQTSSAIEDLTKSAVSLFDVLSDIKKGSANVMDEIGKTDKIISFVDNMAKNTNLLGLNAAIEAARMGIEGRGFTVVADEIRKVASSSKDSAKSIDKILTIIKSETMEVSSIIQNAYVLGESQAAASEEISATIFNLEDASRNIARVAQII